MCELKPGETTPDTSEDIRPPSFEELPEWFREEIVDNNVRRHVDRTAMEYQRRHFALILVTGAAFASGLIVSAAAHLGFPGLPAVVLAGGVSAYLINRLEASEPLGALIASILCLPPMFLFTDTENFQGLDALPFFSACVWLVLSGALISIIVAKERAWRLPF